jgi:hypothetical protein
MNFHTRPVKGWTYTGDVNIEHGGLFLKTADLSQLDGDEFDWVEYVECRGADGCDNQYAVENGVIYCPAKKLPTVEKMVEEYGADILEHQGNTLLWRQLQVEYVRGYYGTETNDRYFVQLGKNPDEYASNPETADVVLAHNAKIENYLIRKELKEV